MRTAPLVLLCLAALGCSTPPAAPPDAMDDVAAAPDTADVPADVAPVERRVASGDAELFTQSLHGRDGGPVLIVLHGGPGLSHEYLEGLRPLATPELRVVFYDQRAVGRSTGALDAQAAQQQVEDLEAVRQAYGAERVHLLGHSAGGILLMFYAQAHPERVASAMFVDSASPTRAASNAALNRFGRRVEQLVQAGVLPDPLPQPQNGDGTEWLEAVLPAYFFDTAHPGARSLNGARFSTRALDAVMTAVGNYDHTSTLGALAAPSLVFAARVPFGYEMARPVAAALPAASTELVEVTDCGHIMWVECPEQFFPRARAFLERVAR